MPGCAAGRHASPGVAHAAELSRRRAAARRGLHLGFVPAEQDVPARRHLHGLPRAACAETARRGQCAVHALPQCRQIRHGKASFPQGRRQRARNASTATCRRRTTWWSMRGAITASACRVRICPARSAARMPARSATPSASPNGPRRRWTNGTARPGASARTTARRCMPARRRVRRHCLAARTRRGSGDARHRAGDRGDPGPALRPARNLPDVRKLLANVDPGCASPRWD